MLIFGDLTVPNSQWIMSPHSPLPKTYSKKPRCQALGLDIFGIKVIIFLDESRKANWRIKMPKLRSLGISVYVTLLMFTPQLLNAGWVRTYGGDSAEEAVCVRETADGGYVVLGETHSFGAGKTDIWLFKVDAEGNTVWTKTYGEEDYEFGTWLEVTKDSGFVVVGSTSPFDSEWTHIWLLRMDKNGDTLWSKTYGMEEFTAGAEFVTQVSDSGYVIIGERNSWELDSSCIWFIKTDANGDTLYTHSYGGNEFDNCICAQRAGDGYIVLGYLKEENESPSLMRLDSMGFVRWIQPCTMWRPQYVQQAHNGGYVVTGCSYTDPPHGGWPDFWITKYDSSGLEEWQTYYGEEDWEEGFCIEPTNDNGYIITGAEDYMDERREDLWLLKVDAEGDTLWTRMFGEDSVPERGVFVQQTSDGGYIALGEKEGDLWLIKTDSLGYVSVEEKPIVEPVVNWEVVSSVGSRITLRYANHPVGFHASIFDAAGRKIDELHSDGVSGTITWGESMSPGVYFIRSTDKSSGNNTARVVIIH